MCFYHPVSLYLSDLQPVADFFDHAVADENGLTSKNDLAVIGTTFTFVNAMAWFVDCAWIDSPYSALEASRPRLVSASKASPATKSNEINVYYQIHFTVSSIFGLACILRRNRVANICQKIYREFIKGSDEGEMKKTSAMANALKFLR